MQQTTLPKTIYFVLSLSKIPVPNIDPITNPA